MLMGEHSPRTLQVDDGQGKFDFEDDKIKYYDRCDILRLTFCATRSP